MGSIEELFMKPKFVEENEFKPYGFQSNALGLFVCQKVFIKINGGKILIVA